MLSFMARGYFGDHDLLLMPLVAFLIFVAIFMLVTVRAFRTKREVIDSLAGLPLVDDASPLSTARRSTR